MKTGRNAPCPCGSGKKHKHCCAGKTAPQAPTAADLNQLAVLFKSGRYVELERHARMLLEQYPEAGLVWKLLSISLQMQGKNALDASKKAAKLLPDDAEAHNNLGSALQDVGQLDGAVASYRRALEIKFDYADAHYNLGIALKGLGQLNDAIASYRKALSLNPHDADAYFNLGIALYDLGQIDAAVASYRNALICNSQAADVHYNLGLALQDQGLLDDAVVSYRQVLKIKPVFADAYCNLGVTLAKLGRLEEAITSYAKALEIDENLFAAGRSYLAALLYRTDISVDSLFEELSRFAVKMSAGLPEIKRPFANSRGTHRKLRIGYVSSDFRHHPVGRNIQPLIGLHDRNQFEIYLYGDVKRPDGMTDYFKGAVDGWRSIAGLSDHAAAEMIRRDKIDILVLLAGRFDENRPLIAACRAAPVQVSFHDPITSGLKAMDYLLTDHGLSPHDTQERFSEHLIHLPTFYVHPPMTEAPEVSPLPAREKGYITFGSFNNPAKVNERVVALWARVLHLVPGSRLRLKYKNIFGNESLRRHYLDRFLAHGIEAVRVDLVSASDTGSQHLARYADIDIALDTFPFTGSTTTFEALWMGVPVVTLLGDHMVARWSGAMLKKLKLAELVAHTEDEYVELARHLAQDLERLQALRAGLRERVAHSPLCDEKGRTHQIERTYRWMWAKWCAEQRA
ncbi:MAG: tetratricopeptide repeat protein [Burkholderiales bacterium]|nr:tetratricopeptide repeat protein [Burkholderiales bacterium]